MVGFRDDDGEAGMRLMDVVDYLVMHSDMAFWVLEGLWIGVPW